MLLLFPKGIHNVEGIAVDWMGNNLYWTDDGPKKTISVARLEKAAQTRKTLIEGKMTHPRAIVVDPLNGCVGRQGSRGAHGHGGEDPPGSAALHTRGVSLSPRALVVAPKLCQWGHAGQELLEQRWQQLLQPRGSSGHRGPGTFLLTHLSQLPHSFFPISHPFSCHLFHNWVSSGALAVAAALLWVGGHWAAALGWGLCGCKHGERLWHR